MALVGKTAASDPTAAILQNVPSSAVPRPHLEVPYSSPAKSVEFIPSPPVQRLEKWYHGGVAGAAAACFTHPIDLLKVQLQTQTEGKLSIWPLTKSIVRSQGFFALYNGISASLLRQLTYSTTRFGIYQQLRPKDPKQSFSFFMKCLNAGVAGGIGGFVGAPADLLNVRMQNDGKLPAEQRRNYKHALDGILRVTREEGVTQLWKGSSMVVLRSMFVTIGQLSFYDQFKQMLIKSGMFTDTISTHLLSSSLAGAAATTITLPFDVLKTRMQNAKPGQYRNLLDCVRETAKAGPLGFFKGYIPAFIRIGPHTVLMFVFLEQIRLRFGTPVPLSAPIPTPLPPLNVRDERA